MFEYDIDTDEEISGSVYTDYHMIKDDTADEKQKAYLDYLDTVNDKNAIEETGTETALNPRRNSLHDCRLFFRQQIL